MVGPRKQSKGKERKAGELLLGYLGCVMLHTVSERKDFTFSGFPLISTNTPKASRLGY